jgi:hypothetical protein
VSNRERIALQERETAEQKGKHQNRTERIDGWRSNRESDVYISNRDKGSRNRTRQRDRETQTRALKQESENKNEGWADRCFVWEERERWKRTLFNSQTYPSHSIKRKESGREVVGLEKGAQG